MSTYLEKLRKKSAENFNKLKSDVDKLSSGGGRQQMDDRFWNLTVDKSGNGMAVLRFLPAKEGEEFTLIKKYSHFFKGDNGKFLAENCPTTFNEQCPICEENKRIWASHSEEEARKLTKDRKRKLEYVSNVLVLQDRQNPDNEGKVFLYRYGAKIFEKITQLIKPDFEDEASFDPFCLFTGANFVLKAKTKDDYRNYDNSYFDKPAELFDGNERKINEVLENIFSLEALIDRKLFKSYDELEQQLKRVSDPTTKPVRKNVEESIETDTPKETNELPWEEDSKSSDGDLDIDDILAGLE